MRKLYGIQLRVPIIQYGFQPPQPLGQFVVVSGSGYGQTQAVLPACRTDGKVGVAIYGYAAPDTKRRAVSSASSSDCDRCRLCTMPCSASV